MLFAWHVVKYVRSNAIVIAKDFALRGAGAGQMNRVRSVRLAVEQAGGGGQRRGFGIRRFFSLS